jgi:vacuolar-type H+-ATPase subunit I/STV1
LPAPFVEVHSPLVLRRFIRVVAVLADRLEEVGDQQLPRGRATDARRVRAPAMEELGGLVQSQRADWASTQQRRRLMLAVAVPMQDQLACSLKASGRQAELERTDERLNRLQEVQETLDEALLRKYRARAYASTFANAHFRSLGEKDRLRIGVSTIKRSRAALVAEVVKKKASAGSTRPSKRDWHACANQ